MQRLYLLRNSGEKRIVYSRWMGHSFYQNFGHLVFRADAVEIRTDDLERLHAYMAGVARQLRIASVLIGGIENHIHLLGNFPVSRPVSDAVRDLKTSTTHWLHFQRRQYTDFSWNQGYGYFSVSASAYSRVADYIHRQREHHACMSFQEEYELLIKKHSSAYSHA